jgi:sulfide:quinone oxidoreductase
LQFFRSRSADDPQCFWAAAGTESRRAKGGDETNRDERVNVLIAGGGVAALEAALALRELAGDRVSVELVAPEPLFWYRPLAVAEPFGLGEVRHFELSQLAAEAGAVFSPGELVSVDTSRRLAYTSPGGPIAYSKLLIACGAVPKPAIEGALTFRSPADTTKIERLLAEIEAGDVERVAFAVPAGAIWSMPAYELALLTSAWLTRRGIAGIELALVTPEEEPLRPFGREASGAVRALLDERGIALHTGVYPVEARTGELLLVGGGIVVADRVVALPRLQGPRIGGIPQTFEGFISVDLHGRVAGLADVYAAGDITTFSVKQGGIATQQADAAAEAIAAAAGADIAPKPFRPVLRGLLLTGAEPRYLHGELAGGAGETSEASLEPLWWPPAKIVGHHFAPFLARLAGTAEPAEPTPEAGVTVEVEVELDAVDGGQRRDRLLEAALDEALDESAAASVGDVMSDDPLVVAPEDTLGQVAEKMAERDTGSALVGDFGRLIGILTSRDMLHALAARVHPSEARVREWMTAEPITVSAETSLDAAAILMTEHHIHHLPVVEEERPVGMVRMRDVVRSTGLGAGWPTGIGLGF